MRADLAGAILLLLGVAWSGQAVAAGHGFALFSELKNPAGFTHFAYANPDAPKGGTLREGSMLTFDSLNPLRFPGNPPNELDLTFDSLMVRAEDEPASYYGLIAERVVLAEDFSSIRFHLRPEARWHDGTQIRANDIAVTFRALRAHGLPGYRAALEGVEITVIDPMTIEFRAGSGGDWLYLDLVATFPIQSARFWAARDVSRPTLDIPTGSGPYRIVALEQNDRVSLQREPGYWGRDLPVNRGRWNFDRIEIVYFRDRTAMIEALKAGRLDINREFDASRWAKAYDGPRLRAGDLVRRSDRERSAGRLDGLVFNLRRPPLDDARVRAALTCAFDADWTREVLHGGLYEAPGSLYGATDLAARHPAGEAERALLAPFADDLPEGFWEATAPPGCDGAPRRARLRRADALLRQAGWELIDQERRHAGTGTPLTLEFVGSSAAFERVLLVYADTLAALGIALTLRRHSYFVARKELLGHNFDLARSGFAPDFPPGPAERFGWHSENANGPGYALAGAADPALDAAIDAMAVAESFAEMTTATRVFDRVMRWRHYLIPLWRRDRIWIAHDRRLRFPEGFALRRFGHLATLWWAREAD